ncbi:hypothetical protein GGI05_005878, partial [Coemansia sp. RSA 2603]
RRLRAQAAAAVAVAPAAEPAEPLRLAAGGSRQIEKDCTERDDAAENISDSFVAKIDRPARALLWSRFACGEPRADEQHVAALVHKAERMTLAAEAIQSPVEAPQSPVEAPQSSIVSSPSPATKMPHFLPDEWLHWAAFIGDTPARAPLDPHEMQRRLAWAHDQQPDAWRHGFRDHPHRGKLLRTYPGLSVELHAYADGNLKRCVAGHSTTLFFANGDWQCDVREPQVGYYYYCAERVWCCQRSDGSVEYRYDDGRVERVDARGSSTVTYCSGEVVVQLGAHACSCATPRCSQAATSSAA